MKPFTSCCCFDLRTGGLIIGWLGIIGCVLSILRIIVIAANAEHIPVNGVTVIAVFVILWVALIVVEVFWIVGIHKNKEGMMMPSLVLSMIGCVIMLIGVAFSILMAIIAVVQVVSQENYQVHHLQLDDPHVIMTLLLITAVVYTITGAFVTYCTAVKYYLYKEIKELNQRLPPTNVVAAGENGLVYKFGV